MKLRIFLLLMLVSGYAMGQVNYLPLNSRYRWIAGKADSTFHIPKGITPSLRIGGSNESGALFYKTSDSSVYVYTGVQWIKVSSSGSGADSTIFATLYRLDTAKANIRTSLNTKIDSLRRSGVNVQAYKNGTWVTQYTDSVGSGGGGSQTLQQTTDLGDSTTRRIVSNDTLKGQDLYVHGSGYYGDTLYSRGDSLVAFGTSITAGSGVSGTQRFSALLASRYGMIEANFGAGGATLNSLYTALYKIPTKTSNRGALMFEYGMNDAATLDTNTFKTRYRVIVDTAIARGWTPNKIILVGGPFSEASLYTHIASYSRAAQTVAEEKGTKYFNAYSFMQVRGGTSLTADSVHPTAYGHVIIAQAAKTAYLEFKKVGLVDVTGDVIGRRTIFAGTPATSGQFPYGSVLVSNGKSQFRDKVFIGDTAVVGNAGLLNITASTGQTGVGVKDASSLSTTTVYGGQIDIINSSGNSTKFYPSSITVGNGSLSITGSAGRRLMDIGVYGGITINEDGNTDDFRIEGDGQTHLFYTNGTTDKIGIRTSSPDSIFTVNGSVRLASTVRLSGLPTGKQAFQIYADANGTLYRGDSTVGGGGGGGGTTYKIGTFNAATPDGNGASIVGDSIYMQLFSAENPGLVPSGGNDTKFLRGDGTWQTVSGGSVNYVDTIYRKAGKDSIFFKINGGAERAIKDSVGGGGSSGWALTGNSTTGGWTEGDFLGTTNNRQLLIRTNNTLRLRIDSSGAAGTFKMFFGNTSHFIDYGVTSSQDLTLSAPNVTLKSSTAQYFYTSTTANAAFYNGDVSISSSSVPGTTKLLISGGSTAKSVMNWSSTTKKTTAADGDWTRDANGVYYGKSTTWNEILMTASVNSVSPTSPNRTITVVVNGVTYYIHAKTTND